MPLLHRDVLPKELGGSWVGSELCPVSRWEVSAGLGNCLGLFHSATWANQAPAAESVALDILLSQDGS